MTAIERQCELLTHPPHEEGSRRHVISYCGGIIGGRLRGWFRCSEPRCEVNRAALDRLHAEPGWSEE